MCDGVRGSLDLTRSLSPAERDGSTPCQRLASQDKSELTSELMATPLSAEERYGNVECEGISDSELSPVKTEKDGHILQAGENSEV